MRPSVRGICLALVWWLILLPAWSAEPSARKQVSAREKLVKSVKQKGKTKVRPKAKASSPARNVSAHSLSPNLTDEKSLDAEIAEARMIVATRPRDIPARVRLANASIILANWVLNAEAVGDMQKAASLSERFGKHLHDTAWRVQKMAQDGDLMARQAVGFLLGRGILLQKDQVKACIEYQAASEKHASAAWHAAGCLMDSSPEKAWVEMERAAARGHAAALEWVGRRCLGEFGAKEKDFSCARTHLSRSASQGRPRAQTLLAYLLMSGQGGPVDIARATSLYKAAAERGDADAQNNLGEIHESGRGLARNLEEAMRWYEAAALQGLPSAQFNAGRLWAIGAGGKKDPEKARAYLLQAESKGVAQARQVLDWLDTQRSQELDNAPVLKSSTTLEESAKR